MIPNIIPLPSVSRDIARDYLIDQLRSNTLEEIIDLTVRNLKDYKSEENEFLRRRKWCLSQIHSDEELRAMVEDGMKTLEPIPYSIQMDAVTGTDITIFEAGLWEAWFGLAPLVRVEGGTGWGGAEDIDWGDSVSDASFDDVAEALEYSQQLTDAGVPNTGVFLGADGKWHVQFSAGSD